MAVVSLATSPIVVAADLQEECEKSIFHCITYIIIEFVTGDSEDEWNDNYDDSIEGW